MVLAIRLLFLVTLMFFDNLCNRDSYCQLLRGSWTILSWSLQNDYSHLITVANLNHSVAVLVLVGPQYDLDKVFDFTLFSICNPKLIQQIQHDRV